MDPRLTEWLKQPKRILWGFVVVVGLMLWGPDWFVDGLGLQEFIDAYRKFIGVAFLFFTVAALAHTLQLLGEQVLRKWKQRRRRMIAQKHLHDLTDAEKKVLRGYIVSKSRTQDLEMNNGVTAALVAASVISQASPMSVVWTIFPYNIQTWAWDYLREHPELLD